MTAPEDQRTVIARIIERHGELRAVETADYAEIFDARGEKVALTTRPDLILLLNTLVASLPQARAVGDEEVARAAFLRQIAYDHFADPRLEREYAILNAVADSLATLPPAPAHTESPMPNFAPAYTDRATVDFIREIAGVPEDLPNHGAWEIELPAGHWRALLQTLLQAIPAEPTPKPDEMVAFGASEMACVLYPGEDQQALRAAFIDGASRSVAPAPKPGSLTADSPLPAAPGWRCFHCDETFTDETCAREHFGAYQDCDPICKVGAERYRDLEDQLAVFRNESDAASKEFYALGAKHTQERMRAEEQGYERGLRDARHQEIWRALLKAQPLLAPGWRGMDEQYPSGDVLLWLPASEYDRARCKIGQARAKFGTASKVHGIQRIAPTHWQPLPSPPSPSEEVG